MLQYLSGDHRIKHAVVMRDVNFDTWRGIERVQLCIDTGFEVSEAAILRCKKSFKEDTTKTFALMDEYSGEQAELTMSIDVIYHLLEDDVFFAYMDRLFSSALRYAIIYSSNTDDNTGFEDTHVRHRKFTDWVTEHRPEWELIEHIPNKYPYEGEDSRGSFADFYIYRRIPA